MANVTITSLGHFHPATIVSNEFLGSLDNGSDAEWTRERTGIVSRASVLSEESIRALRQGKVTRTELMQRRQLMGIGAMTRPAWEMALARWHTAQKIADVKPAFDTLVCGTSIPDWAIPANACVIAQELGLENIMAFDANSACSSFVVDLHVMRGLAAVGSMASGVVVNPERYSVRLDYADRKSCVLFGDAATCALISAAPTALGLEVVDTVVHSDPAGAMQVKIPEHGFFDQNGAAVQKFAITKTVSSANEIMDRHGLTPHEVRYFVGHQANLRMLESACSKLGFTSDQHLYNVDHFGNQGAAGAPAVLSMNWDKFRHGDLIVVAVVGSGLTWAATLLRYKAH